MEKIGPTKWQIESEIDKRRNHFLNALSHDLRTPINALTLQTEVAQDALRDGNLAGVQEALDDISRNAENVVEILHMLVDYARMELITDMGEATVFDLKSFVEQIVSKFKPSAVQKGLFLHSSCTTCLIACNKLALLRILANLIDNAIKFTPEGSVLVSMVIDADTAKITVKDTGPGVPAAFRTMLFSEFSQANNQERDPAKGFGLGLAITKRLVTHLHGDLDVISDITGSRFIITIPTSAGGLNCRGQSINQAGTLQAAASAGNAADLG